jgi:hypothetical protein
MNVADGAWPIQERDASDICDAEALRAMASSCRPTIIRGHCSNWPIVRAATQGVDAAMAYLAQFDGGLTAEYFSAPAALQGRYHYGEGLGGFNFSREAMNVRDAMLRIAANSLSETETGYMGSLSIDAHFPGFMAENFSPVLGADVQPRLWVGNRSTVACHYDSYDNLACVVAGRRRFTLYPPEAISDLYVGPIDHTLSGQPVSMVAGDIQSADAFPRFARAKAHAIILELGAGDALYLPKLWWHQVEALEPVNILVNYWWDGFSAGRDSPYTALLLAMIAVAERPAPERAAWRAYFDHYVFRPDGHPLAHLPEEKHGVLGPLAQGNYGRIRTLVMRMLRGG